VTAAEKVVLGLLALSLVATVLVLDRLIGAVAAAIASVLDLIYALVALAVALIGFAARIRRIVLRLIVTPVIGPPPPRA
jgi:hypothetical protein